jgi:predicted transcriptional regulator
MYETETLRRRTNYRNTLDILADILAVVLGGVRTQRGIEKAACLSFSQLKEYLDSLLEIGMITREGESKQSIYRITRKGINLLRLYQKQRKMMMQSYERQKEFNILTYV